MIKLCQYTFKGMDTMNYISLDTEYTGFYSVEPHKSGELLQVAAVAIVDGVRVAEFNEYCKPLTNRWSKEAEAVHGISRAHAMIEQHPKEMAVKFLSWIESFDRVFTVVGWNCRSDQLYMERLCGLVDLNRLLRCTRTKWNDSLKMAKKRKKMLEVSNWKLGTLCKHFGVKINAHDALSDAVATWEVTEHLMQIPTAIKGSQVSYYNLTEVEKHQKFLQMDFVQMNGDGSVYITEKATQNRDALRIVMEELWRVYIDGME